MSWPWTAGCRSAFDACKAPERIEILPELPLDEVGKVDRRALRARALAERSG
jgi:acyl-coenzyme A synthetase/AMP-(fatty) acid ligase